MTPLKRYDTITLSDSRFYPNGCSKRHFFPDGDLLVRVGNKFFLVHKIVVLPSVGRISGAYYAETLAGGPLVLDGDPLFLEVLLQVVYSGPGFSFTGLDQCLSILMVIHGYEATNIETMGKDYLLAHVPTSCGHFNSVDIYRQNSQYLIGTLWVCKLYNIIEPLPWALYMFRIHQTQPPKPDLSDAINARTALLAEYYTHEIRAMSIATASGSISWDKRIVSFYASRCVEEDILSFGVCCRRSDGQRPGCGLTIGPFEEDPLHRLAEALNGSGGVGLCDACRKVWRDEVVVVTRTMYANICAVASQASQL